MNKETLTLLERCQREVREMQKRSFDGDLSDKKINELIVFTLKQAAEELDKIAKSLKEEVHHLYNEGLNMQYSKTLWNSGINKLNTEAQKVLLGELDK
jgi:hypothetical protein